MVLGPLADRCGPLVWRRRPWGQIHPPIPPRAPIVSDPERSKTSLFPPGAWGAMTARDHGSTTESHPSGQRRSLREQTTEVGAAPPCQILLFILRRSRLQVQPRTGSGPPAARPATCQAARPGGDFALVQGRDLFPGPWTNPGLFQAAVGNLLSRNPCHPATSELQEVKNLGLARLIA